jgi:hypothetical protein
VFCLSQVDIILSRLVISSTVDTMLYASWVGVTSRLFGCVGTLRKCPMFSDCIIQDNYGSDWCLFFCRLGFCATNMVLV